jgi:hypothetical protein
MKFSRATKWLDAAVDRSRARVATRAAAAFALLFAAVMVGTTRAQDASKNDSSSWERMDSVLVLPPIYQAKDKVGSSDACAEDCPSLGDPGIGEAPSAVAGTADTPENASAGTADDPAGIQTHQGTVADASTPDGSGSQEQQAAAADNSQPSIDSLEPSIGSTQEYQEQQEAQELGNYGIVQAPAVIVGAPAGLYYLPGTSIPATSGFAAARSLPSSPAWMPQPMQKLVPLPSIVPHGLRANNGSFPGGFAGGFHGGFAGGFHGGFAGGAHGGFAPMMGFHGGFGHR